ncbi:MAG TPA: CBS domain-containing protein [Saprospiraceae bacterium]|nr:CBS domain-containing protein [Saprospiraceae bacterium]HQW57274.1 CBS domain-containing protein [Saprospiraceae bacterium]
MIKNITTISPDDKLDVVREIFRSKRLHHLPVVENDKLVGLLTTVDLLWLNRPLETYNEIKVSDVMTTKLATLESTDKIGSAAELFLLNRFHAVPVVENGKLIGLVTSFDILKYGFKKAYPTQDID